MTLDRVTQEVIDLHEDFEQWMRGNLESLDRVEATLAPDFLFVGTSAAVIPRAGVIDFLREGKGQTQITIGIDDVALHWQRGGLTCATYIEVQEVDGTTTRRRSTAVFEADDDAPNGLRWLSVHETWID